MDVEAFLQTDTISGMIRVMEDDSEGGINYEDFKAILQPILYSGLEDLLPVSDLC